MRLGRGGSLRNSPPPPTVRAVFCVSSFIYNKKVSHKLENMLHRKRKHEIMLFFSINLLTKHDIVFIMVT